MYGASVRHLYEPCANREFPLSRLPYLKNRMAAIAISTAVATVLGQ